MANEETIIRVLDLPAGRDWVWLADCNVVGLSSRLDEDGRQRALDELQVHWRRKCIRLVGNVVAGATAAVATVSVVLSPVAVTI